MGLSRGQEIRRLQPLTPAEMRRKARGRLTILPTLEELHGHFAATIASEIISNHKKGRLTRLILPVGPTGQYPVLADIIGRERISLAGCRFFFMDEYCDDNGYAFPASHPLSFKGEMEHLFFSRLKPGCGLKKEHVVFPDHHNLPHLKTLIEKIRRHRYLLCRPWYSRAPGLQRAGTGRPGFRAAAGLSQRVYHHHQCHPGAGGRQPGKFSRKAVTLGMKQILSARKIAIYCRNDIPGLDWANTVLRLALFRRAGR